jgi:heavy metal translocating P-type ATPase
MNKTLRFLRAYRGFSIAAVAAIIGLVLLITGQNKIALWVIGVVSILETLPLLKGMWEDLRSGTYGIDILAITAIVTSVVLGQGWAAIVIVLMLTGGEALEDYADRRARNELTDLLTRAPQTAHVIKSRGKTVDVPASQVNASDKLIIKSGEVVPVDAVILEGSASFDESSLTGESLPQTKDVGEQILSGSINLDGAVTVKALHSAADSQYEQIIKLVKNASNSQAPFVRLADRYAVPFTAISFAIAGSVWAISGHAIRFLEVIVVATPCPLILAAPIAIISGMSRAAKSGIIIKNGSALERLAQAQTFAFDKTGTLTEGEPKVSEITAYNKHTKDEVLAAAASIEQNSSHILARAILAKAIEDKISVAKSKHAREIPGQGLSATYQGHIVIAGRLKLMQAEGVNMPAKFPLVQSQTAMYIAISGELAGVITFEDAIRPESKNTLERIKKLGIKHLLMVTGDNQAAADTIAKKLGITDVTAEALPADKLIAIEKLTHRPVVFVGDGVNDAPVLTASDVGIALGARGSTAASESADMVILPDNISYVGKALFIAQRTFEIARQSILVGISLSIILMIVFATGHFKPIYGAAIQELVDVIVIFNALRVHTFRDNSA